MPAAILGVVCRFNSHLVPNLTLYVRAVCIDQGFFIDDTDTMTLEHPEEHSFHCLLDVDRCQESGYLVLTDKNEATKLPIALVFVLLQTVPLVAPFVYTVF